MKWYFVDNRNKKIRVMDDNEIRSYLSEDQIREAVEDKQADPLEDTSYYIGGACFVVYDF